MASRKSPRFAAPAPTHPELVVQHYTRVLSELKDQEERCLVTISLYEYILQHWPNLQNQVDTENLKKGMLEIEAELQSWHEVSLSKKIRLSMTFQTLRSFIQKG